MSILISDFFFIWIVVVIILQTVLPADFLLISVIFWKVFESENCATEFPVSTPKYGI